MPANQIFMYGVTFLNFLQSQRGFLAFIADIGHLAFGRRIVLQHNPEWLEARA